ncbi:hypothetical protein BC830DRAFT_35830 [Chytriomyces sp. MP71]|nr:hypothetical protein BC830DRAFT_35830 [Chytriomyces sp. MP71]
MHIQQRRSHYQSPLQVARRQGRHPRLLPHRVHIRAYIHRNSRRPCYPASRSRYRVRGRYCHSTRRGAPSHAARHSTTFVPVCASASRFLFWILHVRTGCCVRVCRSWVRIRMGGLGNGFTKNSFQGDVRVTRVGAVILRKVPSCRQELGLTMQERKGEELRRRISIVSWRWVRASGVDA